MQSLEHDTETLRKVPFFAGLPTARLKLIAYTAEAVRFEPGEVIVRQGAPADAVYIITDGEAEVWLTDAEGHSLRLWTVGPYSLLGETAVLCRSRRTATISAKTRVATFRILANVFVDLLRQSRDFGMQVMTLLARRLELSTALLQQGERGGSGPERKHAAGAGGTASGEGLGASKDWPGGRTGTASDG